MSLAVIYDLAPLTQDTKPCIDSRDQVHTLSLESFGIPYQTEVSLKGSIALDVVRTFLSAALDHCRNMVQELETGSNYTGVHFWDHNADRLNRILVNGAPDLVQFVRSQANFYQGWREDISNVPLALDPELRKRREVYAAGWTAMSDNITPTLEI